MANAVYEKEKEVFVNLVQNILSVVDDGCHSEDLDSLLLKVVSKYDTGLYSLWYDLSFFLNESVATMDMGDVEKIDVYWNAAVSEALQVETDFCEWLNG